MDPFFELPLQLPIRGSRQIVTALHGQLRQAIFDGRLKADSPLPPTRQLATFLGVSRNTVIAAYDRLIAEGHAFSRQGSGTRVSRLAVPAMEMSNTASRPAAEEDRGIARRWPLDEAPPAHTSPAIRYDFRLGMPDIGRFPFQIWQRLQTRALRSLMRSTATYEAPEGRFDLRQAIAGHVSFARAVACDAQDVVVTAGAQQAFDLIARVMIEQGRTHVAVEDPGYPPARWAFARAGAKVTPVPVDGEGLIVERVPADIAVIMVTPSHQFPVGVVMSPRRRAELLDFANRHDAVIVEDDYDGEFRFSGLPVEALQTLDRTDRVFYVGTFSKSLLPALRLGYIIAPYWAHDPLIVTKQASDWFSPSVAQGAPAAFITEGHLARHVRAMRRIYGERRTAINEALARHCADIMRPIPSLAGLHMAAHLDRGVSSNLDQVLSAHGLAIEPLERYQIEDRGWTGLVLSFGTIGTAEIDPAIRLLANILGKRKTS